MKRQREEAGSLTLAVNSYIMPHLSLATEQALKGFLCEHFEAIELRHLARGIFAFTPDLLHLLPADTSVARTTLTEVFLDIVKRHGMLDDDFFRALCAARPRLRDSIHILWRATASAMTACSAAGSPSKGRLRLRLEIDLDDISSEALVELLDVVRSISGDARMVIESASKGSTVLIIKGSAEAVERLERALSQQGSRCLGKLSLIEIEPVSAEPSPRPKILPAAYGRAGEQALRLASGGASRTYAPTRTGADSNAPSDAELLTLWTDGNGAAGNELTRRHYKSLYLAVRRKIGDEGIAEDIVHQTFLLVMKQRDKIREGTKFRGYLHCIAHRLLCDRLRQIYRGPVLDPDVLSAAEATDSLSGAVGLSIDTKLLYRALRELPLEHALTLELYVWEELTAGQISELMEVSLSTVRQRIRQGKEELERLIIRYRADPSLKTDELAELGKWFNGLQDRVRSLRDGSQ